MAKALGIGGVFFKCRDRQQLSQWYARHLGLAINEQGGVEFNRADLPGNSFSVWGPFDENSRYFSPSTKPFMINLIVDDLATALKQVEAGGATLVGGIEDYDYGRFGWFIDPEGNKIELWQPG
ncbi:VOC family protein [Exilibacterium tricleocarpae]|uniref:VOC family protein n=1 Tax=Exilibacterium tricleocarpae TaxID=2591008 RepID=A0A545SST1_9GAMM|nr:VOC family protein [Exilibacterium tricleocarpae]TQV67995.1 VOC family protein [Exilibacterium tricleocarpae]